MIARFFFSFWISMPDSMIVISGRETIR